MNFLSKATLTLALTFGAFTLNAGDSLIPYTSVKDAKGEVKAIYDQVKERIHYLQNR